MTLIWIVASVFQQSLELRAQRLEFKKMVEAQDAQVKALEAQSDIFKDERKRNNEKLANGALNNEIRLLIEDFLTASDDFVKITAAKDGQIEEKIFDFKISVNYTSDGYRENYRSLRMLLKSIRDLYSNISTPDSEFILKKSQAAVESLGGLRESLTSIYMFREKVSFVTIETLNTLNIPDAINKIENLEEIYRSVLNEDRAP